MSVKGLNELVGRGCISDIFQAGLMNGRRAELIGLPEFDLEPDEAKALLAIKAESFTDFAAAVEGLAAQSKNRAERAEGVYMAPVRWSGAAGTRVYFRPQR
jgi:hypothetical protein